jgi:hypothetical protein
MANTWFAIEYVLTAPGRLLAWYRWAVPGTGDYHDDAQRDSRALHWSLSFAVYGGVYSLIRMGLERGLFDQAAANLQSLFGLR